MSSDRQQPEEQLDLEGDDDIMDDDDGYRRRDDSEEPEEYEENDDRQDEADSDGPGEDDTEIAVGGEEQAAEGDGSDDMDKGGDGGPEDAEEKKKWDELLALPPHGSEVFIGGLPRDITEEDLRELCEPLGEIYEVCLLSELFQFLFNRLLGFTKCSVTPTTVLSIAGEVDQGQGHQGEQRIRLCHLQ
jgi:heterogeneous nuclear ribonucleoprotein R